MKREEVSKIFEGATDDQLKAILDLNSNDIGNAKGKSETQIKALTEQVEELKKQIEQRDSDLKDVQNKLTAAQADSTKLGELQTAFSDLQSKYDADKLSWDSKVKAQAYDFAVREKAHGLAFTSEAAKRDFIRQAIEKKLQMDDSGILGFDDFVKAYTDENENAFKVEEAPKEPSVPKVTLPATPERVSDSPFTFSFSGIRPRQ